MNGGERAAAARSAAAAIARVSETVAEVGAVVRRRVRGPLSLAGPAAAPMRVVDGVHDHVHDVIRTAAPLAGEAAARVLDATAPAQAPSLAESPRWSSMLSGLSAAFGDQLPGELAVPMSWRMEDGDTPGPALAVFIHGLGGHDGQWGRNYLATVRGEGLTPVLVRYNTGRAIADNGATLDELLAGLCAQWPVPVERIVLIAHSMGGLVAAAAVDHAGPGWADRVTDVVTLGTPHSGAPLERIADLALRTISLSQAAAPIAQLGGHRSQGIKDLADGWHGSLPARVRHHAVVAYVGGSPDSPVSVLLGDGLVPQSSAAGRNHPADSVIVVALPGTHHNAMLDHPDVDTVLRRVAAAPAGR